MTPLLVAVTAWDTISRAVGWRDLFMDEREPFAPVLPVEYWMPNRRRWRCSEFWEPSDHNPFRHAARSLSHQCVLHAELLSASQHKACHEKVLSGGRRNNGNV